MYWRVFEPIPFGSANIFQNKFGSILLTLTMVGKLRFLLNPCIICNDSYMVRTVSLCLIRSSDFKPRQAKFDGIRTVMVNPFGWLLVDIEKNSYQVFAVRAKFFSLLCYQFVQTLKSNLTLAYIPVWQRR